MKMFIKLRPYNGHLNELNSSEYKNSKIAVGSWTKEENWYTAKEMENTKSIGFLPPKGYVVVDCDNMETVAMLEKILDNMKITQRLSANKTILKWETKKGVHYLFKTNENIKSKQVDNLLNMKFDLKGNRGGYVVISERIDALTIENYINSGKNIPELPKVLLPINNIKTEIDFKEYPKEGERDNVLFTTWVPELFNIYKGNVELIETVLFELVKYVGQDQDRDYNIKRWIKTKVKRQKEKGYKPKTIINNKEMVDNETVYMEDFYKIVEKQDKELWEQRNRFVVYFSDLYFYDLDVKRWINYGKLLKGKKDIEKTQIDLRIKELFTTKEVFYIGNGERKRLSSYNVSMKNFKNKIYNPNRQIFTLSKSVVALNTYIDNKGVPHLINKDNIPPFTTIVIPHNIPLAQPIKPKLLHKLDLALFRNQENIEKVYDISSYYISNYSSGLFLNIKGLGKSGLGTRHELLKSVLGTNCGSLSCDIYVGKSNQFTSSSSIGKSLVIINELVGNLTKKGRVAIKRLNDTSTTVYAEQKGSTGQDYPLTASQEGGGNSILCVPLTETQILERLVLVVCNKKTPLTSDEYNTLKRKFDKCVKFMLYEFFKRQIKLLKNPINDRNERYKIHNNEYIMEMRRYDGLCDFIEKMYDIYDNEPNETEYFNPYKLFTPRDIAIAYSEYNNLRKLVNEKVIEDYLENLGFSKKGDKWLNVEKNKNKKVKENV